MPHSSTEPLVHVYDDLDALSAAAAEDVVQHLRTARPGAPFALALAGGSTPRALYRLLATTHAEAVPWSHVHVFWGDERFVPPDHPDSNYRMADEALLAHVPLPAGNVHRMPTTGTPAEAAARYEADLRAFFGSRAPSLDLTLLGLGDDGHTASLFPGTAALDVTDRWVTAGTAPSGAPSPDRLTLTFPLLNRSREVFFLAAGTGKHPPLRAILDDPASAATRYPAARIRATRAVHWFVDAAAYAG